MATTEPLLAVAPAIEAALWAAAERVVGRGALGRASLEAAITARSRRYTSERELLGAEVAPRRQAADLAARAVFFSVCDAPKPRIPIWELAGRDAIPRREPLRILDLGAGCGAMTLGALDALAAVGAAGGGRPPAEILAVDRDADALAIAAEAMREPPFPAIGRLEVERALVDRFSWRGGPYDLVIVGTLLNELDDADALSLLRRAVGQLADDGAVIAIEPALRDTSRALHRLRDAMLAAGAHVFAPCTRTCAPCPTLADPRDWCHEDRPVQLSPRASSLADATGLREHGAKFSYLVLRREPYALVEAGAGDRAVRVVSRPRKLKGVSECFVCGDDGRVRLRRLKRERSSENRGLDRARRGDVLVVPEPVAAEGRAGKGDRLTRIEPAKPRTRRNR